MAAVLGIRGQWNIMRLREVLNLMSMIATSKRND
jgi:hypothetical protein